MDIILTIIGIILFTNIICLTVYAFGSIIIEEYRERFTENNNNKE